MIEWLEFVEAPLFTKLLPDYLADDDYAELQSRLALEPEAGGVMPGTGGFRKLRWPDRRRGAGRRGGLRVVYYYFVSERRLWLVTLYSKGEVADLSPVEKRALKTAIERELRLRRQRWRGPRTEGA